MSKRTFMVRASFPVQGADLVETVTAGNWPAALGLAARRLKQRMPGSRIRAASFTIEQVKSGSETRAAESNQQQVLPGAVNESAGTAGRGAELSPLGQGVAQASEAGE